MNKNSGALPFICFGSGDDFKDTETIKDRVITINEFFPLNEIFIQKNYLPFEPVSMFFRQKQWSKKEMLEICYKIAKGAIENKFI